MAAFLTMRARHPPEQAALTALVYPPKIMSTLSSVRAVSPRLIAKLIPIASAACMCCTAWAQEVQAEESLPAISVKASRNPLDAWDTSRSTGAAKTSIGLPLTPRETPQSVSTVTREQIEQRSLTS